MSAQNAKPNLQTLAQARKLGLHPIRVICQSIVAVDRIFWAFTAHVPRPGEEFILEDGTQTRVREVKYAMGGTRLGLVGVMMAPVVVVTATGQTKDEPEDLLAFLVKAIDG